MELGNCDPKKRKSKDVSILGHGTCIRKSRFTSFRDCTGHDCYLLVAFVLELSKISGVFSAFCFPFPKSWPRLTGDSSKQPASKRTHPRSLEVCCATILTITRRVQNVLFFPLDLVLESRVDREFE